LIISVYWTIWKKEKEGMFQTYLDPNLQPYVDIFLPITLENIAARGEKVLKKSGALLPSLQNASRGDQVSKLTTVFLTLNAEGLAYKLSRSCRRCDNKRTVVAVPIVNLIGTEILWGPFGSRLEKIVKNVS
jgi:hypothetical protein